MNTPATPIPSTTKTAGSPRTPATHQRADRENTVPGGFPALSKEKR